MLRHERQFGLRCNAERCVRTCVPPLATSACVTRSATSAANLTPRAPLRGVAFNISRTPSPTHSSTGDPARSAARGRHWLGRSGWLSPCSWAGSGEYVHTCVGGAQPLQRSDHHRYSPVRCRSRSRYERPRRGGSPATRQGDGGRDYRRPSQRGRATDTRAKQLVRQRSPQDSLRAFLPYSSERVINPSVYAFELAISAPRAIKASRSS